MTQEEKEEIARRVMVRLGVPQRDTYSKSIVSTLNMMGNSDAGWAWIDRMHPHELVTSVILRLAEDRVTGK